MRLGGAATPFARTWGLAIVTAWALVAGALLLRLAAAYAAVARMKRDATPFEDPLIERRLRAAGHRRRAAVACSAAVEIPCAVGFRRPMILVPARLASSLDADDLARVVLHESAHLQRYDDWVNALEQIVCALQFFQPALYFARRSIDFEREVACDDRVLEDAGEPLRYAECLARIVQRHVRGRQAAVVPAVVPGFVLRRAQVVARVRRIVDRSRDASPHLRLGAAVLGGGVMIATLGIARLQVPVVATASAAHAAPVQAAMPARPHIPTKPVMHTVARHKQRAQRAQHEQHAQHAHPTLVGARQVSPVVPVVPAVPAKTVTGPAVRPTAAPRPDAQAETVVRATTVYAVAPRAETTSTRYSYHFASSAAPAAAQTHVTADYAEANSQLAGAAPVAPRAVVQAVAEAAEAPRASGFATVLPVARRTDGDLLDAIDEAKYPHPSVDDLIALRNQGVSADYVRRMGALGRNRPALRDLVVFAMQGVTPDYVATLDARLASPPSLDQVLALRVQGVSAAWLDGLAAVGYPKLRASDAASLAVQGVSVAYVRGLLDAGLRGVTPSQLAALRVQGVDGTFVRRLADHGYRNLSIDELVRLKVSGLQP
jgi:beta-lactamase regulating signal transducer with metallopeptidase domain